MTTSKKIAKKAEQPIFDDKVMIASAHEIVEHHFGSKPKSVTQLGGGLTNYVCAVVHSEGEFIVRFGAKPGKIEDFLKEQWAITQAAKAGVPTAEVLEVGAEPGPFPHMVARKAEGVEATHHPERFKILKEMGRLAKRVHGIKTSGYGQTFDWSSNQLSLNKTWKEYLHGELGVFPRMELLEKHNMLEKPEMKKLVAIWRDVETWKKAPVLNHGDMRLKNVLVDEKGDIQAVIDWEFCNSNVAPFWDMSLALHDLSIDAKHEFLSGYGLSERDVRDMAPVMKAINLVNYAPFIERAAAAKDKAALDKYRTRLSGALDLYSI